MKFFLVFFSRTINNLLEWQHMVKYSCSINNPFPKIDVRWLAIHLNFSGRFPLIIHFTTSLAVFLLFKTEGKLIEVNWMQFPAVTQRFMCHCSCGSLKDQLWYKHCSWKEILIKKKTKGTLKKWKPEVRGLCENFEINRRHPLTLNCWLLFIYDLLLTAMLYFSSQVTN